MLPEWMFYVVLGLVVVGFTCRLLYEQWRYWRNCGRIERRTRELRRRW